MRFSLLGIGRASSNRTNHHAMKRLIKYTLGAILAVGISHNADAILTFTLDTEFSGAQQPAGSVEVVFDDHGGTGAVDLTITSQLNEPLGPLEFMSELYLNFNPDKNPDDLASAFTETGSSGFFTDPLISLGVNQFKADGDGFFDILFTFDNSDGSLTRFDDTDSITYTITLAGLVEEDFNFLSAPGGGHGPFSAAAHIQGVGLDGEGSGFIAPPNGNGVPDGGTTMMLLGSALACLGALRRRFV
jgi:hypothetical protein